MSSTMRPIRSHIAYVTFVVLVVAPKRNETNPFVKRTTSKFKINHNSSINRIISLKLSMEIHFGVLFKQRELVFGANNKTMEPDSRFDRNNVKRND